jgi:hypothetical protein
MKKSLLSFALFFLFVTLSYSATAQKVSNPLKETYEGYISLKNDLVKDAVAGSSAELFVDKIKAVKAGDLSAAQLKAWNIYSPKILKDAEQLKNTKDLEKQRKLFSAISDNMYPVVKTMEKGETIYYQFCPMKKSYWLSSESGIKNPYYGKSMLTCGSTKEVLQ